MKLKTQHIALIFVILFSACTPKKNQYFDTLLKTENGIFRGVEIGNSIAEIKQIENIEFLIDDMPDYLYYDYKLDMGNSYTISYDFSDNKLYEIELAAYFDQIEDANQIFKDFSNHFNKIHGKGKVEDDGYTAWRTKNEKTNTNIEIAMVNDSKEYGYISILISNLDY
ncbi:MAG: hypothetical protein H6587_09485 [Flavobacteriales bacterium]|nr:hypothetical protein [Flavobacteriales bacterium]MCB9364788.1 hypothetical protein [Flavobacteriales bacterium]